VTQLERHRERLPSDKSTIQKKKRGRGVERNACRLGQALRFNERAGGEGLIKQSKKKRTKNQSAPETSIVKKNKKSMAKGVIAYPQAWSKREGRRNVKYKRVAGRRERSLDEGKNF